LGFASTRAEARQLVVHKAILVNDKLVNIPSFLVNVGDVITVRQKAKSQGRIQAAIALSEQRQACEWITVDAGNFKGSFMRLPNLGDLSAEFNVNLVVELYSK
jgi:small subunit ribosomal protein S4